MIVAEGTPPGRGAVSMVRLSGAEAHDVVGAVSEPLRGGPLRAGRPRRVRWRDAAGVIDDGLAWLGDAPNTLTGEPTAELWCHGNPHIVARLIAALVASGARPARPGEFTRRAVVHGRVDLITAEAVDQVVRAASAEGAALARAGMDGSLAARVAALRRRLVALTAEVEGRVDWPLHDLELERADVLARALTAASDDLLALAATAPVGRVLVEGASVALVGVVNAGKSSLLNALLGRPRALVHATPGTTRDVLEARDDLDGVAVTWLDTAGERETSDPVEAAGQALARALVDEADLLVHVVPVGRDDGGVAAIAARLAGRPHLTVSHGSDRGGVPAGALATSAVTGDGVAALRAAVRAALVGGAPPVDGLRVGSARQAAALRAAGEAAARAAAALEGAGDLVAAEAALEALEALDALTGADTREDVLDAVFSRFCVGK